MLYKRIIHIHIVNTQNLLKHKTLHFKMQYIKNIPEVPDFAMVPKFLIKSSFVIPIPLSRIDRIFFSLSNLICITLCFIKGYTLSTPQNTNTVFYKQEKLLALALHDVNRYNFYNQHYI